MGVGAALVRMAAAVAAVAAGSAPGIPIEELIRPASPASTVDDSFFSPTADAVTPPSNGLDGRLSLRDTTEIRTTVLKDTYNYAQYASRRRLPLNSTVELSLADDGSVVPADGGLVVTNVRGAVPSLASALAPCHANPPPKKNNPRLPPPLTSPSP